MSSATAYLAFYNASNASPLHKLIACLDGGEYSHVELAIKSADSDTYTCLSASRTTGVRSAELTLDKDNWLIIKLPNNPDDLQAKFNPLRGLKYDWFGLITSRVSKFPHSKGKYFCSELVAELLDLKDPETWGVEELLQHYMI